VVGGGVGWGGAGGGGGGAGGVEGGGDGVCEDLGFKHRGPRYPRRTFFRDS